MTQALEPVNIPVIEGNAQYIPDEGQYIPNDAQTTQIPHEIIGIIGAPGSGKTTSILTFPNRVWYDFDHKLPAGEVCIPMWDADFVASIKGVRQEFRDSPPNRRDAFRVHFRNNHSKFTEAQTLIIDSWTILQNAIDQQTQIEEDHSSKPNPFSFWKRKAAYSIEICEMIKACKARVVVTFHEAPERNEEGMMTGKLKPVMDGGFKDQLFGHFTDVWHQVSNPPEVDERGIMKKENGQTVYSRGWFWNLTDDKQVNTNCNPLLSQKIRAKNIKRVVADYNEIIKLYNS